MKLEEKNLKNYNSSVDLVYVSLKQEVSIYMATK